MESRVCPVPSALLSYTSAPSSPGRTTTLSPYFFSVPTSPSRSDPRTPDSDHFRFGSMGHRHHEQLPIMAYADELFCGGRMLPLKLPPRLHGGRMVSSTSSSPSLRLKIPFKLRRSSSSRASWNDEFDPFVTALEKVKENDNQRRQCLPRRSRSLSPLKWGWGLPRSKSMGPDRTQSPTLEVDMMGRVKPAVEARRHRIKKFLLKSASLSFGWKTITTNNVEKKESRAALVWRPHESTTATTRKGNAKAVMRISRGIKSLVKHKPRLFSRTR